MTITETTTTQLELFTTVFENHEHRDWGGGDYLFEVRENGTESDTERLENDTLLVLEQDPRARWEFIRFFQEAYEKTNPFEYIRWGKAFNWEHQEFNGEVSDLYVEEWALPYVTVALKLMTAGVLSGKYAPRRSAK